MLKKPLLWLNLLIFIAVLTGCASKTHGYGPSLSPIDREIQKIAIVKPDIYSYEVSGGGIPEFRIDWSSEAEKNISAVMIPQLKKFQYESLDIANIDSTVQTDTIQSFVKYVSMAISSNLYGEDAFLPQIDSFNYSVGSLTEFCDQFNVNAVMFIFGADEHYSELRKEVLQRSAAVKTAKSIFWSVISTVLLGGATFHTYSVMPEQTFLCCVVADRSGKIIWFKRYWSADGLNLAIQADAEKAAEQIVAGFNRRKKQ
jgi:hypothetical protein